MHALSDPNELLALAASLARTGEYRDWPAVRARLTELGFVDIETVMTPAFVAEIDQICAASSQADGSRD